MREIFSHIYFFFGIQTLFLSLIVSKAKNVAAKKYLVLLLLLIFLTLLSYYSKIQFPILHFQGLAEASWFSISPMFYLYTKALLDKKFKFQKKHVFLFSITIYNVLQTILYIVGVNFQLINEIEITSYSILFIYVYIISALLFNSLSMKLIHMYITKIQRQNSSINKNVLFLKRFFFIFNILLALFFMKHSYNFYNGIYSFLIEFLLLALFAFFVLFISYKSTLNQTFLDFIDLKKYKNSNISTEQFENIDKELTRLIESEKLYLIQSFSLVDLAIKLGCNSSQLSQFFSQYKNVSFYDFINLYRIREFVKRVKSKEYQQYKIESIAKDSGFKNKAVFYKYFKNYYKMTPKQYLNEIH